MADFDYCVVGAGFAGSACAERLAAAGKSVVLVDRRSHVAGNAYDYHDAHGILVHKYGAHIFHTNSAEVFEYLSRFTAWRPYEHRVLSRLEDGRHVPVPINDTTLAAFGGDEAAAREALVAPYTRKQWGCRAEDLDPSVLARIKTRPGTDDRYFLDRYQAMPAEGYTQLVKRMLAQPKIRLILRASHQEAVGAFWELADRVIYTGPIDEFFDYRLGRLPYRSATFRFETEDHGGGYALPAAVVNVPSERQDFTRVAEFRQMTGQPHRLTTFAYEYPSNRGEPFWPVPTAANLALAAQYKALARTTPGVYFCGRLGTYNYLNVDQAVAQALKLTTTLLGQEASCQA